MTITINDKQSLGEIKEAFNNKYPHLKLEFYDHAHKEGEGSPVRFQLEDNQIVGEIRKMHSEGELSIHANQKVNTLETRFKEIYGLNVQVFRKSNKIWLQTTATDEWTLAHQEHKGELNDR